MLNRFYRLLFFFFVLQLSSITESLATHIVGGNLAYEYLGPVAGGNYRYRVTFKTYIDCNSPFWGSGFPEPNLPVGVYEGSATPASGLPRVAIMNMPLITSLPITPSAASTCAIGTSVCIHEVTYVSTVDLPLSFVGYHLFYDRCCRVGTILNLNNPGNQGLAFHAYIPPTLVQNNSPVFTDIPIPFLCVNDTASVLNTAFDADGDVLIFSFEDPYQGFGTNFNPAPPLPANLIWPIPPVNWQFGFNKNQPFGASGYAFINASTGYTRYMATTTGDYSIAVEIKEYRNGTLIGITRRDMQLLIVNCPNNPPPNLSSVAGSGQTAYTITEGDTLCFPAIFHDQLGDSVTLTAAGAIFNSASVNPPATINTPVIGDSVVSTQFCWETICGQAKALPYIFTISVTDNGCPHKTINVVYSIKVNPFQGPTAINGPNVICSGTNGIAYNVTNIPGASFNWTIIGGTQASGGTTNSITVNWGVAGTGTIQVSTSTPAGCLAGPISKTVIINSGPTGNAGIDTAICSGASINIGSPPVVGNSYSWTPSTGLNNTTISNPTLTLTNTGVSVVSHTYVVTVTSNSCTATDNIVVSVRPLPTIDAGANQTVCLGNNTQLSASGGNTYIWTPATGLSNPTISNPIASPSVSITYSLNGTDINGCRNTDTTRVTVVIAAAANAGPDVWVCPGDSVQLNGSGGTTYLWSPSNGLSSTTIAMPMASPSTTTNYFLTVTDANSCTGSDTVIVTIAGNVPSDAGADKQICFGNTVVIGGSPTGPTNSTYSWSPTTGLSDPTSANPVANPIISTTYIVTVMNDTCMGQDTIIVNVLTPPPVDAGGNISICLGDNTTLTASGAVNYLWTPATGLSVTTGANPIAQPTTSITYYVTGTDTSGCSNIDSVRVTVNLLPVIDAGPNASICNGNSTQLSATGGLTYSWTPSAGLSSTTGANPVAQPSGSTTYFVTGTNINGCRNIDSVRINLSSLPVIDAGSNDTMCFGGSVQLTASGGINYTWSPSAGLSSTTGANPLAGPSSSTTYYVTVTDTNGCMNTDSVRIIVIPLPNVNAGNNTSICLGKSTVLNASGAINYTWTPSAGLSTTTGSNPVASPTASITYYVSGQDVQGCANIDSVRVTVNPLPIVDAGANVKICLGDSASLTATGATSYVWIPASALSNPASGTTFAFPTISTTYTVTGTDANSCANIDTVTVFVFTIDARDTSVCLGQGVVLSTSATGAISYSWSPAAGLSDPTIANPVASPTILTTYTVTAIDTSGCVAIDIITVTVNNNPTANFTAVFKPTCDNIIGEFTNSSSGATTYVWYFGDGDTSSLINPEHIYSYSQNINIRLIAINGFGCKDTFDLAVSLSDFSSYLTTSQPNIFTPNFDGVNDQFNIGLSGEYLGCTNLKIYNRWGTLLFEADRFNHSWDGRTTAGEEAPDGTYYYVYKIKDIELKGFITLLR